MSTKHILKHTETEVVFKCYITAGGGGTIDLSVENDMTKSTQVYVAPTSIPDESTNGLTLPEYTGSHVYITGIWWGCKAGKQLDITRIVNPTGPVLHGHYYLDRVGAYEFTDFYDRVYANRDIRLVFDGEGHCIIRLRKNGWLSKIENERFGAADDVTAVGS